jgi:hypothetical protein
VCVCREERVASVLLSPVCMCVCVCREERVACLLLLHHLLSKLASEQNDDTSAKAWFADLCQIVDTSIDSTPADLLLAARQTIIDGMPIKLLQ